jgi:uncharacterized protein (DUF58 family)
MMEDTLPSQLHGRARFVLDGLGRREARAVTYRIPALPRGRYEVGPLRLRLTDPFRMVDLNRSFTATSAFVLTPVVDPLPGIPLPRSWDTGENLGSHSVGARGADDASTREYRRGDDLRKIHWRSTARTGSLMVRHEERPWQGHTVLLLDTRHRAHEQAHENNPDADPRELSSLEWAVSAAASIATHMLDSQREVTLVVGGAAVRHSNADSAILLDSLGRVEPHGARDLSDLLDPLREAGREATLIAVVGRLDPVSLRTLTEAHPRGSAAPAFAILLDVPTWLDPNTKEPSWQNAAAVLRAAGWNIVSARRGDTIASIWAGLVGQRPESSAHLASLATSGLAVAGLPASAGTGPIGGSA